MARQPEEPNSQTAKEPSSQAIDMRPKLIELRALQGLANDSSESSN